MRTARNLTLLKKLARRIRFFILLATTEAGSGHPTSSLSAVELMTALFFSGIFKADLENPNNPNNDRLIFSKGHGAPLLYALYGAAEKVSEEDLKTLRKFGSPLEGHPSMLFPYTEAATGSLGQGLSIGIGMAMSAKYIDNLPYKTYVLMGDSEISEGSVWEAAQIAAHYRLDNLIGIIDVNRLGQRGETMYGHDILAYKKRFSAFGWNTIAIDGHSLPSIINAYQNAQKSRKQPTMIIAKTVKGKGVSFLENKDGWHGKTLTKEQYEKARMELGNVDETIIGKVKMPKSVALKKSRTLAGTTVGNAYMSSLPPITYPKDALVATRKAYGNALLRIFDSYPNMIVLDAEVGNSTFAETFAKARPSRFFEMYIAEQNMAGVALGLSMRGKLPFASTFAAFLTRAFDQIRMSQYSRAHIVFAGSHAGVSIGEDGASQMGLEDIAMFRAVQGSAVLYPGDAVSTEKLVKEAAKYDGIVYIRTTRKDTPIIYGEEEAFPIGGCKIVKKSEKDGVSVISAGITLHESLKAYEDLKKEGIMIRVIDLYSVKPIDTTALKNAVKNTNAVITVEDHCPEGGIGEAVASALSTSKENIRVHSLAVRKPPKSGSSDELLEYEEISARAIIKTAKAFI